MISEDGSLIIESNYGLADKLNCNDLYDLMKPVDKDGKLNIDVIFVNIINGIKIANVFKKLGVG